MVEVLISALVIALALLGLVGLQASALKLNKSANLRMQAVMLSEDIIERMENNKTATFGADYVISAPASVPTQAAINCSITTCDTAALAAYDLAKWQERIIATLPGSPAWKITKTSLTPVTYEIVLTWKDRRDNTKSVKYDSVGTDENFSITSTKVFYP